MRKEWEAGLMDELSKVKEWLRECDTHDASTRDRKLDEYVRALNCYLVLDRFLDMASLTLDEAFTEVVRVVPNGMRQPGIACARIVFQDNEFIVSHCQKAQWRLSAAIQVGQEVAGYVEVGYLERPEVGEHPFTEAEEELIKAIGRRLGRLAERCRDEAVLRKAQARYRGLAESITDVFFAMDRDLNCTYWNRACEELTGVRAEDALGKNLYDLFPRFEHTLRSEEVFRRVLRNGQSQSFTNEFHAQGQTRYQDVSVYPSGEGLAVFIKDVTERKRAENALRESEEKFKSLAEYSPNMIFINCKGRVIYANKRCEEVMGYTREEIYSSDFDYLNLIAPESRDLVRDSFARYFNEQEIVPYEYALLSRYGSRIEAILTTKLISYGGDTALLGIVTDITERKAFEQALVGARDELEARVQERTADLQKSNEDLMKEVIAHARAREALEVSEERLRKIFESVSDGMALIDLQGVIVDCNDRAAQLGGHVSRDQVLGHKLFTYICSEDHPRAKSNLRKTLSGKDVGYREYVLCRVDGSTLPIEVNTRPLLGPSGNPEGFVAIIRDISERKRVQEELRALSHRLVESQEQERRYIARELHDQIGQSLTVLKLLARRAADLRIGDKALTFQEIDSVIDEVTRQVRNLSLDLRPGILD
ncbi:MAG: PAS domain S-box protein, partial [Dehalococcoidia bacterium]|nr:PAS domain S-box protein [Dehalococcoidia bacterium]